MTNWNPSFYRPDSRLECPLLLSIPAFSVKFAHARMIDREALIEMYRSSVHLTKHWRESLAGDPWQEPVYKPSPNRQHWYESTTLTGVPEIYLSILHEWTYDLKAKATVLFAQEMELQAEDHNLDTRYDVYLVYGVEVNDPGLLDPVADREFIRAKAMLEIENKVMDDLWYEYLTNCDVPRPGQVEAMEISQAIRFNLA